MIRTKLITSEVQSFELLVRKLICHRYDRPDEQCLNNQRFIDNYQDITVKEVDVAALSVTRRKIEGYECKVNPTGFEPYDCINLDNLAEAADNKEYRANVGFVCFESDNPRFAHFWSNPLAKPNAIDEYSQFSHEQTGLCVGFTRN